MYTVQLAVGNAPYGVVLSDLLTHTESCCVQTVDEPDPLQPGVLVVNEKTLDSLSIPINRPERVVLITPNDARRLERAWQAGIRSVVFDSDPPRTMALAVMAAALRVRTPNWPASAANIPPSSRRGEVKRTKIG
jgi:hypothetical protein